MTEEQRDSLVEMIQNSPDFEVKHISGSNYRVLDKSVSGELPFLVPDNGVAVFGHTFVPVYPKDGDKAFRYYITPIWEREEFSKEGHKKLQGLVEQFIFLYNHNPSNTH